MAPRQPAPVKPLDAELMRSLAQALLAELRAPYEAAKIEAPDFSVTSPAHIYEVVRDMEQLETEQLRVVLMDTKHHVLDVVTVYQGTVNSCPARLAELFREAVRANAFAIALAHNHPSGDPAPSYEDRTLTAECIKAGQLLGIEVLDHIVVGRGRFQSIRELMPSTFAPRP